MIEILNNAGVPIILIIIGTVLWFYLREVIKNNINKQAAIEEEMMRRALNYLDQQLNEFYLPIKERLSLSVIIYQKMKVLKTKEGKYENSALGVESKNELALRNIVVRRVYMPLNSEAERLILDKSYLKVAHDSTNYSQILAHFRLWRAFEEATSNGEISDYNGTALLQFPSKEVETFMQVCDNLVAERNCYRERIESISRSTMALKTRR